jgi:glycine/D-amino acid oxidase-like deaminating enzyme
MASRSGSSLPLWSPAGVPLAARLEADAEADVCVVGAGIAGLSTAYELVLRGLTVVVIDQARLGQGMTGRTTAHFTNAFDDRYVEVERLHGAEAARLVAESHTAAIERAAEITARESFECGLARLDGWLRCAFRASSSSIPCGTSRVWRGPSCAPAAASTGRRTRTRSKAARRPVCRPSAGHRSARARSWSPPTPRSTTWP